MKTVTIYVFNDDHTGGIEGEWAAPTLAEAKEAAKAVAAAGGTEVEVQKLVCGAKDLRRLACGLFNHERFVREAVTVGRWAVEQNWKEGDYLTEPDHKLTWEEE